MLAPNPVTTTPSIRGLIALLRDRSQWPEGFVWYPWNWNRCGIGLANAYWKIGANLNLPWADLSSEVSKVYDALGIERGGFYEDGCFFNPGAPEQLAATLERLTKKGE